MSVDGVPLFAQGFPVGGRLVDTQEYFVYNHVQLRVKYHESESFEGARIVGLELYPVSISHNLHMNTLPRTEAGDVDLAQISLPGCDPAKGYDFFETEEAGVRRQLVYGSRADSEVTIAFSYDVFWEPSDIEWASRWDVYLSNGYRANPSIHWWGILNSTAIVVLLTGMVSLIMVRALHRDLSRYNRVATDEERADDREETGWKLVHGDVFRPPTRNPVLFAVTIGTGTQLLAMLGTTIAFSAIGFVSPARRGSLMASLVLIFMLLGTLGGYVAARVHKMFNGKAWQRTTLWTAFLIPGVLFGILFTLNLFVWAEHSVNAVPFTSMLAVLGLWLLVSVPLVFLGAYLGFRGDAIELPKKVRGVPRQIPHQPWYLSDGATAALGGLLPFGTMYVELLFIMSSIWHDQYYYVFGFLLIVAILTCITSALLSIVLVYFTLVGEDYNWWWKSFRIPASAGVYLFLYSMYFYAVHLNMHGFVPALLYFGYMAIISAGIGLALGVVGFHSTFEFVRRIYAAVRTE
ncbi:TMN7 [Symbiodinium sp. KB8]|nr:TMN7 [Symbiodinium sp. KB8]